MEDNKASSSASSSSSPSAVQTLPSPSSSSEAEARVEAVLTGMNRFAALSRAFVKPSNATATSASAPSILKENAMSNSTPLLSSSNTAKPVSGLAAGTSLMDRVQPGTESASANGHASAHKGSGAPSSSAINASSSSSSSHVHHTDTAETASAPSPPTSVNATAAVSLTMSTPSSQLYRPPHARDDASKPIPKPPPQQQQQSQLPSTSPAHTPVQRPSSPTEKSNSSGTPATASQPSPSMKPAALAASASWSSAAPKATSPGSTLATPPTTMAARLREGASGAASTLLPPSVNDAGKSGEADASAGHAQHRLQPQRRDTSTHSCHSFSHAEDSNSGSGGGVASYLAVARRAGSASTSATPAPVPPQQCTPSAAATATAMTTTEHPPEKSPAPPSHAAAVVAGNDDGTSPLEKPLELLVAEEVSEPLKLSRSAKRKRKLRAVKAAAAAAALAEAQANGTVLPVSPKKTATVAAKPATSTPVVAAPPPAPTAANTCGVSRRPGWHASLAATSAMANGEPLAGMAGGCLRPGSPTPGGGSSSNSSHPYQVHTSTFSTANSNAAKVGTNAATAATTSSGAGSACGSAGHEPVNQATLCPMSQQQPHQHYHNYYMYSCTSPQQQMNYYSAMRNSQASPGQPQLTSTTAEAISGISSGAAETAFDPAALAAAATTAVASTTGTQGSVAPSSFSASTAPITGATTATASPTRNVMLHRSRGAATHGPISIGPGNESVLHPPRLPASPGALFLQGGHLPTIRVGTAGTLVNAPMPGRNSLNWNNNANSNAALSQQESGANNGGNSDRGAHPNGNTATSVLSGGPMSTAGAAGRCGSPVNGGGAPRHHHHHHAPFAFSTAASSAPAAPAVNPRHLRTSSSYSSGGGGGSPVMGSLRSRADLTTVEDTCNSHSNVQDNTSEHGGHTSQQQQDVQQQQQQQQQQEWSASPLTPSMLQSANNGWGSSPNTNNKTSTSSSAGGLKGKGGTGGSGTNASRTNSGGRNSNNSNNATQVYSPNSNPVTVGGSSGGGGSGSGGGGGGMSAYNNFRNAGGGGNGMAMQGGRYGGLSNPAQQSQNSYMNQVLYADQSDGGMMGLNTNNNDGNNNNSDPKMMSHATGNRRVAGSNNGMTSGHTANKDNMLAPMPYYDFVTVLPTFVSTCLTMQPEDEAIREQLCWTIEAVLRRHLTKNAELRVHGSITTGLALPSSDVDLLVVGYQPIAPLEALQTLSKALMDLDEASLKDALEFQESVEREKQQQLLREHTRDAAATTAPLSAAVTQTTTTTSATTTSDTSLQEAHASASHADHDVEQQDSGQNACSRSSAAPVAQRIDGAAAKTDTGEVSSGAVVSVVAVPSTATAAGATADVAETASQRPAGITLDGRKAFLTAITTAAPFFDVDDATLDYGSTRHDRAARGGGDDNDGDDGGAVSSFSAMAGSARMGRSYADADAIAAAEETEVYDTVDDVEQAEEVFRDQIEKDYNFSTTLDLSSLFAPVLSSGSGGGGVTPKMPSSPSPLNGPVSLPPPPPPSLPSTHASAGRETAAAAFTTTAKSTGDAHASLSATPTSTSTSSSPVSSSVSVRSFTPATDVNASAVSDAENTSRTRAQKDDAVERPRCQRSQDRDVSTTDRHNRSSSSNHTHVEKSRDTDDKVHDAKTETDAEVQQSPPGTTTVVNAAHGAAMATTAAAAAPPLQPPAPSTTTTADVSAKGGQQQQQQFAAAAEQDGLANVLVGPAAGRPGGHLTYVPVHDGHFFYVQAITATRVPVIKLTDKATGTKIDITFAGGEHWRSMQLTRSLLDVFPQARPLILFLKFCVRSLGIGESEPGGVTSFTIYLMVMHFYNECRKRVISILQEREAAAAAATAFNEGHNVDSSMTGGGAGGSRTIPPNMSNNNNTSNRTDAHADDTTERGSTPLPRPSAEEEQQLRSTRGSVPLPNTTASASSTSAISPILAASPTVSAPASAAASATAPLDLGLLEHFLGEYLARVEQRHAQLLKEKAAAAAAAAAAASSAEARTDDKAAGEAVAAGSTDEACILSERHQETVAASSPAKESTHEDQSQGCCRRNSSSNNVGACATIRDAYNSSDKAHLQTIREVILGFVGKPSGEMTGVVTNSAETSEGAEPQQQQQQTSSPLLLLRRASTVFSGNSSPQPQSAASGVNEGGEGVMTTADTSAGVAEAARVRHAPPLHHYLLKTVEPQPHERNPAAGGGGVAPKIDEDGGLAEETSAMAGEQAANSPREKAVNVSAEGVEGHKVKEEPEAGQCEPTATTAAEKNAVVHAMEKEVASVLNKVTTAAEQKECGHDDDDNNSEEKASKPAASSRTADGYAITSSATAAAAPSQETTSSSAHPHNSDEQTTTTTQQQQQCNESDNNMGVLRASGNSTKSTSWTAYDRFAEDFLQRQVNVSDLFLDFCHYYGCAFDYETCGIRFSPDGRSEVVDKPYLCSRRGQHFHLTSPFDPEYDLTARMTHMRGFQWLCWWFTEWGAARQAPMFYGDCSLQYVLQCLSPQSADADCAAVHQALMAQSAARRSRESVGNMQSYPRTMNYYGMQQQQRQPYSPRQPAMDVNRGMTPNMAYQSPQQGFYGPQQQQQQQQIMMTRSGAVDDGYMSNGHGQDLNAEAFYIQQQQQHHQQQQHPSMSSYGQPTMTDPQFQQQQQQQQQQQSSYVLSPTDMDMPSSEVRSDGAGGHAGIFVDRSEIARPTSALLRTDDVNAAVSQHRWPPLSNAQLPFVDSHEALEGLMVCGTSYATSATSRTTNGPVAAVGDSGDGVGGEEEENDGPAYSTANDTTTITTVTAADSVRDDEHNGNSPLERSNEDVAVADVTAVQYQQLQPAEEEEDDDDELRDEVGFDEMMGNEAAVMEAMMAMPFTEDNTQRNVSAQQQQQQQQMYGGGYAVQSTQQQQQQRFYRRPYSHGTAYYDMPQQSQQAADTASFYYHAYTNMHNAYAPYPLPLQQPQQQQQYGMSTPQNFYAASPAMVYPPQHLMFQQQQHAEAAASNASLYPFPFLHYDVQQYLWMQEQQQQQQQQQHPNGSTMRRTLSREQEGEISSTSDATATSPGSPVVMPPSAVNTIQQQQQQPYSSGYTLYPKMYNAMWNSASAGAAAGGGGQPNMQMTRPYARSGSASMQHLERAGGTIEGVPQQQYHGARGGHARSAPRHHVSVHETRGPTTSPFQPQQPQPHAHPSRPSAKPHHSSSSPSHADPASATTAATASAGKMGSKGPNCNDEDVDGDSSANRQHVQSLQLSKLADGADQEQRSQQGTPRVLSPTAVPQPRAQSLRPQ